MKKYELKSVLVPEMRILLLSLWSCCKRKVYLRFLMKAETPIFGRFVVGEKVFWQFRDVSMNRFASAWFCGMVKPIFLISLKTSPTARNTTGSSFWRMNRLWRKKEKKRRHYLCWRFWADAFSTCWSFDITAHCISYMAVCADIRLCG